jgi:eukaryotic-like serine/threonine-protein kinase
MLAPVGCPDENVLARLGGEDLEESCRVQTLAHLDECEICRRVVAALMLTTRPPSGSAPAPLEPGTLVGRYQVGEPLGAGGMGIVYAAWDTRLARPVALKVIHPGNLDGIGEAHARSRVLREAQAMARLSHPNVVGVFDMGEQGERVWMALELSDGTTLGGWCQQQPRSLQELLGVYLEAGRGLAAAHAAGIVHRDFKPQNVLVDRSGRVRVGDFGLAGGGWAEAPAASAPGGEHAQPLNLTRTGRWMGTPRYMAPEQFEGRSDARSDQFAYCVALYEAVAGKPPFGSQSVPELTEALRTCELGPRPRKIPSWLWRVLCRGLSLRPEGRYPDMPALLAALEHPFRRRTLLRRAAWAAPALVVLLGALAVVIPEKDHSSLPTIPASSIRLAPREQRVLQLPGVRRVAIAHPSVAEVSVEGEALQITGQQRGLTSIVAWTRSGERLEWEIRVE